MDWPWAHRPFIVQLQSQYDRINALHSKLESNAEINWEELLAIEDELLFKFSTSLHWGFSWGLGFSAHAYFWVYTGHPSVAPPHTPYIPQQGELKQ